MSKRITRFILAIVGSIIGAGFLVIVGLPIMSIYKERYQSDPASAVLALCLSIGLAVAVGVWLIDRHYDV